MEKKHTFELQQTWQHLEEVANLKYELLVLKFESSNEQLLLVNQAATFADLLRAENLELTKVIDETIGDQKPRNRTPRKSIKGS